MKYGGMSVDAFTGMLVGDIGDRGVASPFRCGLETVNDVVSGTSGSVATAARAIPLVLSWLPRTRYALTVMLVPRAKPERLVCTTPDTGVDTSFLVCRVSRMPRAELSADVLLFNRLFASPLIWAV